MQRIPRENYEPNLKAIPFGELCEPEDVANAVMFLSGDQARLITGQIIVVNGGRIFY